jgi:hypothetical protein
MTSSRLTTSGEPPGAAHYRSWDGATRFFRVLALYTTGMNRDVPTKQQADERMPAPALPEHLSALIGSLHGPADLGRNHDKYMTYTDRGDAGGAASA